MISLQEVKSMTFARALAAVKEECEKSNKPELRKFRETSELISHITSLNASDGLDLGQLIKFATDNGIVNIDTTNQPVATPTTPPAVQAPAPEVKVTAPVAADKPANNREDLKAYLVRLGIQLGVSGKGVPTLSNGKVVCKYCIAERLPEPYIAPELRSLGGHSKAHPNKTSDALQELTEFLVSAPTYQLASSVEPTAAVAQQPEAAPEPSHHVITNITAPAASAEEDTKVSLSDIFTQHRTLEASEDKSRSDSELNAQIDAMMSSLDASITGKLAEVLRVLTSRIDTLETNLAQMQLAVGNMTESDKKRMFDSYAQHRVNELGAILKRKVQP